jgi:MraZ protein
MAAGVHDPLRGAPGWPDGVRWRQSGENGLQCGEGGGRFLRVAPRLLSGTYECSLDDRSRVAIPSRLRDPFADGTVTAWWLDECLVVVPRFEWPDFIEGTFGRMSVLDDDQRELSRFLLAGAFEQEGLDKQGRLLVPAELREHAGLDGKVKVVGAGSYLELWNPDRLAERFDRLRKDGVAQRAARLAQRIDGGRG